MAEHLTRTIERVCDVVVLDAAPASLGAAAELGRRGRSVIVLDGTGTGTADAAACEEVRRNGGEVLAARAASEPTVLDGGIRVALTGGHAVRARAALGAGIADTPGRTLDEVLARTDPAEAGGGPARSANEADWDLRYGGEALWSGNPNGTLVAEVESLAPGRALDVGAGEGGDAIWLAEQGWTVTAADVSGAALARVAAEAARRGLRVECRRVDANAPGAFAPGGYDLVSAQYASIPRTADDRAVTNLLAAVAPGGVLLVVGHDLAPMRAPIDVAEHSRAFDPDAYVRVDDVAAALAGTPGWTVEVHGLRPRPPGAASSHHVDDVVLRARRLR